MEAQTEETLGRISTQTKRLCDEIRKVKWQAMRFLFMRTISKREDRSGHVLFLNNCLFWELVNLGLNFVALGSFTSHTCDSQEDTFSHTYDHTEPAKIAPIENKLSKCMQHQNHFGQRSVVHAQKLTRLFESAWLKCKFYINECWLSK